ncbi:MAG: CRTAC1 family protein [Planctomycetaceae bacterium]
MKISFQSLLSWICRLTCGVVVFISGCKPNPQATVEKSESTKPSLKTSQQKPYTTSIRFSDVTNRTGIHFSPRNGEESGHYSILESIGSGVAVFDYDRDGDLDLLFAGGGGYSKAPAVTGLPSRLYRNEGAWHFTDVTEEAGIHTKPLYSHGVYVADYDADGWPDILMTGYGSPLLFQNRGDGTFEAVSDSSHLRDSRWSTGAAWGDFNGDGHLDFYLTHYVDWSFEKHPICKGFGGARDVCSPADFNALDDTISINNSNGTFRADAKSMGLKAGGKGLGVLAGDFDLDGDVDLYIANDTTPNFLYQNGGNGRFTEIGISSGSALGPEAAADGSMGLEMVDWNRDGRPDLWVTNYEHQNFALYRNDGPGIYQHVSSRTGISSVGTVFVGFGTIAADFDLDGDEDMFVTNGHVMMHSRNSPLKQKPLLFENLSARRFTNVAPQLGSYFTSAHRGRGVAAGDLDRDGDLDLVVTHINAPISILANESPQHRSILQLQLVGRFSSRDPIGASVILETSSGKQVRFVKSGMSYLSTSDTTACFAVKKNEFPVKATINWPGGKKQQLEIRSPGKYVVVEAGSPQLVP